MRNLIVDANNRFIASYIVNPCINTNGNPVGGIQGFLSTLQKSIKEIQPDRVFIIWDGPGGSQRRRRLNENYKDGRKPPQPQKSADHLSEKEREENYKWQQYHIMSLLNSLPVIQTCIEGIEADDVIAFLCKELKEQQKVIVSADKDFYQLQDENTIVSRPTQKQVKTMDDVLEEYAIHPNNFAIARAVDGDKSDAIEGVKGVGQKSLARAFSDLKNAKKIDFSDIKIKCLEEMNKKKYKKIYEKVYDNMDLIQDNYAIMQLTDIIFSIQKQEQIRMMLKDDLLLMFDRLAFIKEFSELYLGDINAYKSLMLNCTHLHNKSKERKQIE